MKQKNLLIAILAVLILALMFGEQPINCVVIFELKEPIQVEANQTIDLCVEPDYYEGWITPFNATPINSYGYILDTNQELGVNVR